VADDADVQAPDGRPVVTVSELNTKVSRLLEAEPELRNVWLRGEISNWTGPHGSSGHAYFSVKDDDAEIDCVMWRRNVQGLTIEPGDGMEVLARGSVGLYEKRGSYQFYIEQMLEAGRGDLYLRYQQLKAELDEEGLFDPERKRSLPAFPRAIGVVTSRDAAGFQDVLNVLRRRSPHVRVLLSDARVQGGEAAPTIVDAIERLNAHAERGHPVDVIVVTRGGGSMEDLWAFNEEETVRAVADSRLPVVAGVGHETDTTLTDLAADERAPTPSAAAEVAAPSREESLERVDELRQRLARRVQHVVDLKRSRVDGLADRPVLSRPGALFAEANQLTDELASRLPRAMQARLGEARARVDALANRSVLCSTQGVLADRERRLENVSTRLPRAAERTLERSRNRVGRLAGRLDALSPLKVLERGYASASRDGEPVRSVTDVEVGDEMDVRVTDGTIVSEVRGSEETNR
jgi:exodeoxyribonuclease VII large subunit